MKVSNIVIGGLSVAGISLIYNLVLFAILDVFPELSFNFDIWIIGDYGFYLGLFLKDMLVGFILMILFSVAYQNIKKDTGEAIYSYRALFFFVLYAVFALVAFTLGDILLMKTSEGMLLVLTLDGMVESMIATVPISIFVVRE
jgi:hypothetical protein